MYGILHYFISIMKFQATLKQSLGSIKKYFRWRGEREGAGHWKLNKKKQGEGSPSMCVRLLFKKKMLRFSKWSFIVILRFFLLIVMAVWNIKQTIMKDYNIQYCQWMACQWMTFASPHKITNVGYVKNIYLQPFLVGWISM